MSVDPSFMAEQRARSEARAARFARESAAPPPPLPTNRMTVMEGKVAKPRSQAEVMTAFIWRKLALDAPLSQNVLEQALALGIDVVKLKQELAEERAGAITGSCGPRADKQPSKALPRASHAGLDDDLDDYFQGAASPPKRANAGAVPAGKDGVLAREERKVQRKAEKKEARVEKKEARVEKKEARVEKKEARVEKKEARVEKKEKKEVRAERQDAKAREALAAGRGGSASQPAEAHAGKRGRAPDKALDMLEGLTEDQAKVTALRRDD